MPAISNSTLRYPAPSTTDSRPGAMQSMVAICSAKRTGSCSGTNAADTVTLTRCVRANTAAATVRGADMNPAGSPWCSDNVMPETPMDSAQSIISSAAWYCVA